jgi:predicted phage tail protein
MVKVNLHGKLGEDLGKTWDLEVTSVAEAMRAIEANTRCLRKWFLDHGNEKGYSAYSISVNNKFLKFKEDMKVDEFKNSEVFMQYDDKLETIDIFPEIIGSRSVFMILVSVVLIVVAVFVPPLAPVLILAGLGLLAAGVTSLLSKPPPLVPFNAQQADPINSSAGEVGGPSSYLFNGPVNTVGEGGPVPVGYGTLLIGSNNVYASYDVQYKTNKRGVNQFNNTVTSGVFTYLFNSSCRLIGQKPVINEINF